ncbi:unknown [Salmonella phage FelixO1]|uniref:Uncharacterized protein n=1 Tax=Salmonella phage Felix O1 (isolate Felix O1-VT1) TaxID=1283336 RepID=Q6KG94_BPFO1|nr:unknown [Salmonella phage FelixO1]
MTGKSSRQEHIVNLPEHPASQWGLSLQLLLQALLLLQAYTEIEILKIPNTHHCKVAFECFHNEGSSFLLILLS